MRTFDEILQAAFSEVDMEVSELPNLDLYMDQILTLFDERLAPNKRCPDDRLITKTMINNYSKEHLIMPVKGKKYSRETLIQLLCILNLKQNLALSDIKKLTAPEEESVRFEAAYNASLTLKARLNDALSAFLREQLEESAGLDSREQTLALILALSSAANGLRRTCEQLIDNA